MTPRLLLVGHTASVKCVAKASGGPGKFSAQESFVILTSKNRLFEIIIYDKNRVEVLLLFVRLPPHRDERGERGDVCLGHSRRQMSREQKVNLRSHIPSALQVRSYLCFKKDL